MVTDKVILQEIKQTCLEKLISTAEEENIILCTKMGGPTPGQQQKHQIWACITGYR